MSEPFIAEIIMFAGNFAPADGPSAQAKSCRSHRIRRYSRSSALPTAATARQPSPCPTCAAGCRLGRATGQGCRASTWAKYLVSQRTR